MPLAWIDSLRIVIQIGVLTVYMGVVGCGEKPSVTNQTDAVRVGSRERDSDVSVKDMTTAASNSTMIRFLRVMLCM